jgi:hypothetical protein
MSATEVIEQIQKLPREERQKVAEFLLRSEAQANQGKPNDEVSEEFKRAADEVFTTNAKLFRKLAQ